MFIESIDDNLELQIKEYFNQFNEDYTKELKKAINMSSNPNDAEKEKFIDILPNVEVNNSSFNNSFDSFIHKLKNEHSYPIYVQLYHYPMKN